MQINFWGARGSLPYSVRSENIRKKIKLAIVQALRSTLDKEEDIDDFISNLPFDIAGSYGGNTSCVEVRGGSEFVVCDAGSGLRDFGNCVLKSGAKPPATFHIFISHLHWDHIHGFPFFVPAFIPDNTVNIYAYHEQLEYAFVSQQNPPHFPVLLSEMPGDIRFHVLDVAKSYDIAGFHVTGMKQNHPGDSYAYCFEKDGKKFVYSTDAEHQEEIENKNFLFLKFIERADLLIFDAQYNLNDQISAKRNWGHSSNVIGVELAVRAKVKRLCMFHHEHVLDDHQLQKHLQETLEYLEIYDDSYPLNIFLAHEGLQIDL
ncbi:MBL fold metallo-hydrolase [Thermodesulfobacteriota bacterium]